MEDKISLNETNPEADQNVEQGLEIDTLSLNSDLTKDKEEKQKSIHYNNLFIYTCTYLHLILVDILLKPTGNAPIMKKKKWAVDAEKPIGWIIEFIKKYLKLDPDEKLVKLNI